jgi:hypothetical protein
MKWIILYHLLTEWGNLSTRKFHYEDEKNLKATLSLGTEFYYMRGILLFTLFHYIDEKYLKATLSLRAIACKSQHKTCVIIIYFMLIFCNTFICIRH